MTEKSWPWSTVAGLGDGAAELGESDSRLFLATYFGIQDPTVEGVSKGVLNELEVTGAATPLAVNTGSAICYGFYYNDASVNLTITTPAIGTTGGRVVLQTNWAGTGGASLEARTRLAVIYSADGTPAIPNLTQSVGTTWEISLATFTVTTGGVIALTDDRTFRQSTMMVDTDEVEDLAITEGKLAAAVAAQLVTNGDSHDHAGGDGAQIPTAGIVNDAVDFDKAGDQLPKIAGRRGGDATDWSDGSAATSQAVDVAIIENVGAASGTITSGNSTVIYSGTFPVAFSDGPIMTFGLFSDDYSDVDKLRLFLVLLTNSSFSFRLIRTDTSTDTDYNIMWRAIGPE